MYLLKQRITKYLSTNLDQPYPEWVETVEYKSKDMVVYNNHIYRSIVNDNIGVKPDLNTGKWLLFGVDNAYAAIDLRSHTKTVLDDGKDYIEFVFEAVGFTYMAFSQVQGSMLEVWEYDSAGNEVSHGVNKIGEDRLCAVTWHDYYYCGIPDKSDIGKGKPVDFLFGVINPSTARIKVVIHKNSDNMASVGAMVGGRHSDIGKTQYGAEVGIIDYTRKETDDYGITTLKKRDSRETMRCTIEMAAKMSQAIKREVKDHLGQPVMFIADESKDSLFENLIIFGYIKSYSQRIINGVVAFADISIEELI